jgi:hypothetical protein
MKLLGVDFDGSCTLHTAHHHVQSVAGTATWLSDYVPIRYETRHIIERLLSEFFDFDICCRISGPFPAYAAGKIPLSGLLFCAEITSSPIMDPLLQRNGGSYNSSTLRSYQFSLTSSSSGRFFSIRQYLAMFLFPFFS